MRRLLLFSTGIVAPRSTLPTQPTMRTRPRKPTHGVIWRRFARRPQHLEREPAAGTRRGVVVRLAAGRQTPSRVLSRDTAIPWLRRAGGTLYDHYPRPGQRARIGARWRSISSPVRDQPRLGRERVAWSPSRASRTAQRRSRA